MTCYRFTKNGKSWHNRFLFMEIFNHWLAFCLNEIHQTLQSFNSRHLRSNERWFKLLNWRLRFQLLAGPTNFTRTVSNLKVSVHLYNLAIAEATWSGGDLLAYLPRLDILEASISLVVLRLFSQEYPDPRTTVEYYTLYFSCLVHNFLHIRKIKRTQIMKILVSNAY